MGNPRIVFVAPQWLFDAAKAAAKAEMVSLSGYVRQAVREQLKRKHEYLLQPPIPFEEQKNERSEIAGE